MRILRIGDEQAQLAFPMLIAVMVIFVLTALAFDAGLWFFAHRDAQNDADAAALAAALELPATDTTAAQAKADQFLAANGAETTTVGPCPTSDDHSHIQFSHVNNQTQFDGVTVCTRRKISGFFAALSGISFVHISAQSTALSGHVDVANVMPWAIIPPDPTCTQDAGRNCLYDANGNHSYSDPGDCNAPFSTCPFGLTGDRLYGFKVASGGNTGVISACGNGASNYRDCLNGGATSGFYAAGQTVVVGLQGGNLGQNTNNGLNGRSPAGAWNPGTACDVQSRPAPPGSVNPGYDPLGKAAATAAFITSPPNSSCPYRLVLVPILAFLPPTGGGNATIQVLGVATFGVASWNRSNTNNDAFGPTATGPKSSIACTVSGGGKDPTDQYDCGFVWGYLFSNVTPPDFLLEKIGSSDNPFAPLLIALTN